MNWIHINDKRPDFDKTVIVTNETKVWVDKLISITIESTKEERNEKLTWYNDYLTTITHWMELPELPNH